MVATSVQPVLVLPVYRGGKKFHRALDSIVSVQQHFKRIVISLNGPMESDDAHWARTFTREQIPQAEIIQTGTELPWMEHQYFWLEYLERAGEDANSWILWFAHDDQLRARGITALVGADGSWPLNPGTTYLGPWGMRYDPPGGMYEGPADAPLESWTSFPINGPLRLSVAEWIAQQLEQPTYINMSGCLTQLASFQALRKFPVAKPGGMRIEMATAAAPNNRYVEELPEPIVITHTSPVTDRTNYAKVARKDDVHMAAWLANYIIQHPGAAIPTSRAALTVTKNVLRSRVRKQPRTAEDWRYRETLEP